MGERRYVMRCDVLVAQPKTGALWDNVSLTRASNKFLDSLGAFGEFLLISISFLRS